MAGIVQRGEAESKDLLTEVKRWIDAGEDREAVKAWAERRQREIRADAERDIGGKFPSRRAGLFVTPPVYPRVRRQKTRAWKSPTMIVSDGSVRPATWRVSPVSLRWPLRDRIVCAARP